jgi:capsular polysaccharide biosynthesis protein
MELRHYFPDLRAYVLLVAAVVLVAAAAAYLLSSASAPTYSSEATVAVSAGLGTEIGGTDDVLAAPRVGQAYAILATTAPVLLEAIDDANLPYDTTELRARLTVIASLDTPFISITMADESPIRAAEGANAIAAILVERATVPVAVNGSTRSLLEIVDAADVMDDPIGPRVLFNTALAGAAAFVAAVVLITVVAYVRAGPPVSRATTPE